MHDRRASRRRIAATLMGAALLLTGLTGAGLPTPDDIAGIETEVASATPEAPQTLMQTRAAETTPPADPELPAQKPSTPAETPTRSQTPAQTPPQQTPKQQAPPKEAPKTTGQPSASQEAPEPAESVGSTEQVEEASEEPTEELDQEELMEPLAVPSPGQNAAVITVKVGGNRTGSTSIGALSGVVLRLYDGNGSGPTSARTEPWATCTSDAQGDCSFTIPDTHGGGWPWDPSGENRDSRFWVVQESAPSGWYTNSPLVTGTATSQNSLQYAFQTGNQLRAGNTYRSGTNFMQTGDNSTNRGSSGTWQNSLNNPKLSPTCQPGLNVALVLDLSGSVANAGAVGTLKDSAKGMVDALAGTGTSMALYTFATQAPRNTGPTGQNHGLRAIDTDNNQQTIKNDIDAYQAEGGTNWDRGMWQVAQSSNNYDLTIVITDGLPTFYGAGSNPAGPGSFTRFVETEHAIFSANAIKATGSRLIAVGVGTGISGDAANLRAISGPNGVSGGTAPIDADYFQAGWGELEDALETLALGATCQAEIEVNKLTQAHGETSTSNGGAGWEFDVTTTAGTLAPGATQTTDSSGTVNYSVTFETPNPGDVGITVEELISTQQTAEGWALEDITCTLDKSNVAVGSELAELTITAGSQVECTFTNKQTFPDTLVVKKDIVSFADNDDQFTFSAHQGSPNGDLIGEPVTTTGTEPGVQDETIGPENIVLGDAGGNYVLKETGATGSDTVLTNYAANYTCVDNNDSTWDQEGSLALNDDGAYFVDLGIIPARSSEDTRREVECVITNTPKPQLTLIKVVDNPAEGAGYAEPGDWDLSADGNHDSIAGSTGDPEVTKQFVEPGSYQLDETFSSTPDKSVGYQWTDLVCIDESGAHSSEPTVNVTESEGIVTTASVTLALQHDVTCTYTNTPLSGAVLWNKVDQDENSLTGSEWVLIDPVGTEHPITDEHDNGQFLVEELIWGDYTLKETRAPAGYLLDTEEHTFTISHDTLEKDFGVTLVNMLREGPNLPLTGGLGRDFFTYLGLGVLLLGTATASTITLRNRRNAKA